jgi:predicted transcriptional regulator of viral defense system
MSENKYNYIKQIPGLTAMEAGVVAYFDYSNKRLVSNKDFEELLPQRYKYKNKFISKLIRKKILSPIKRGFYNYVPLFYVPHGMSPINYIVPGIFFPEKNYYIGYSTLYNTYGFTEQICQITYILNTSFSAVKKIQGQTYIFKKVTAKYMYGIEEKDVATGKSIWSDKERTLVDLIYFPGIAGSLRQVLRILERVIANKECDIDKFIAYAAKFPNIKTRKRIGWTLEKIGIPEDKIKSLLDSVQNTALTPFYKILPRTGEINKKWRVILNESTMAR